VERTRDTTKGARRPALPFISSGPAADKPASPGKEASAAKGAPAKPFKGDDTADRTKDIGQLPRRPALPFAQRAAAALKRPAAPGANAATPPGQAGAQASSPPAARPAPIGAPAGGAPRLGFRRTEPPKAAPAPPRPGTTPPPASAPGEPDPDAITAEKEKKAPRAPVALPPKPALVAAPTLLSPVAPVLLPQGKGALPPEPPPEPEQLGYREKNPAPMPVVEAPEASEAPKDPDPATVSIEQYAAISAELAQKGADRGVVLRGHKLSVGGWAAIDRHWTRAIAEQTERGERTLLTSFDVAYVATQERLRRPIGVPEYARILVGLERGEVGRVLGDLELQLSDLMRLQRVWTKKIADTPKLAEELSQAVEAARRG